MQHAIVPKRPASPESTQLGFEEKLHRLANVEPNDADFLSCYLDLQVGRSACHSFLEAQAKLLRSHCDGIVRLDLEQALDMARVTIDTLFDGGRQKSKSAAVFLRGLDADCHLTVLPLDKPVEPKVSFYRVPDLTQVWIDYQRAVEFTLVLARKGGIQVLDIQDENVTSRGWASYRVDRRQSGSNEITIPQRRFQMLRRSLAGQGEKPIVIAGEGNCLDALTTALPARALKRLRDVTRVPSSLDSQMAVEFVRRRMVNRRDLSNQQAAARLVRTVESSGLAVTGPTACHEALRTGAAEMMVMVQPLSFEPVIECADCGALQGGEVLSAACDACGGSVQHSWDAAIELVRLACREGIPVIGAADDALQSLGGVACLLREPVEIQVMPYPTAKEPAVLDLVA